MTEVTAPQSQTLGGMIDELQTKKDALTEINRAASEAKEQISILERAILDKLDEQGLPSAKGGKATVTASDKTVPNVVDWDEFWTFIKANDYEHLVQRRVSATAANEFFESGTLLPGVERVTLRSLSTRRSTPK